MATHAHKGYYFPGPSTWPITGAIGIGLIGLGAAFTVNALTFGFVVLAFGIGVLIYTLFGWFGTVVHESEGGQYDRQVDRSYRWSMSWFIFSEVMFFAAFFGALFYMRVLSVPWLGELDQKLLWPSFGVSWPSAGPGLDIAFTPMEAWGIPAINTLLLLSSGVTVTWAHWALKRGDRGQLKLGLFLTIALGVTFLAFQVYEYGHAYAELNLKLTTGAYGSTFFMLTGFHGMHVTLGAIMLTVIFLRVLAGHFTPDHHFAFEGVSWYWHFVDVVWLGLFIFVYWL